MAEIETERLVLRQWRDADREPFAEMNADPKVMKFFPEQLSRLQSDAVVDRIEDHFAKHQFGLWAVEIKDGCPFIGFVGLAVPRFQSHFTPCVEVGWRLDHQFWGQGYAPEAGFAALRFAFGELNLDEVVSMTAVQNKPSRRVMEKIGMRRVAADDFDHPLVEPGHPIRRHVLYRITRSQWLVSSQTGKTTKVRHGLGEHRID